MVFNLPSITNFILKWNIIRSNSILRFSSKVPKHPYIVDLKNLPPQTKIDKETIEQLEKVSLVRFGTEKGIKIVEDSIKFADEITLVDTSNVEPLYSVLEERNLPLRDDTVGDDICKESILRNAKVVEDDYFVAPPGNIPLEATEYDLKKK